MGDLADWRNISIVFLALQAFVIGLPILAAGYFTAKYLGRFRYWLATHFPVWQAATVRGRDYVEQYIRYATIPVITLAALGSAVATAVSLISSPKSRVWRSYRE